MIQSAGKQNTIFGVKNTDLSVPKTSFMLSAHIIFPFLSLSNLFKTRQVKL